MEFKVKLLQIIEEDLDLDCDKYLVVNNVNPNLNPDFKKSFGITLEYKNEYKELQKEEKIQIWSKRDLKEDITFIIQGRIDHTLLLKNIVNLSRYGRVIVSPSSSSTIEFIKRHRIPNEQNVYLQVTSTFLALKKVTTKFVIKVRGDEYYHNFASLIEKMKGSPEKIITNNIFFRKISRCHYHISDHIISGTTENLIRMFANTKRMLESKKTPSLVTPGIPEQWLTVCYLQDFYTEVELKAKKREIMIKHFDIVGLELFEDFIVTYTIHNRKQKERKKVNGTMELINHKIIDIKDISQI